MASLALRTGPLGNRLAKHLLRRGTFMITKSRIESFAAMSADQAVNELFVIPPLVHPEGPMSFLTGTPWLTVTPFVTDAAATSSKQFMVWYWFSNEAIRDTSIRHKMAVFWHSIFTSGLDTDFRIFDLIRLFQLYAVGNIEVLARKVTLDNKMLRYLNGNTNVKNAPNENYAREFLELFTITKGPQIAPGNYTNYTEEDIKAAAKVFTGIRSSDYSVKDPETGLSAATLNYSFHDNSNKQFSAAFGSTTIEGAITQADMTRELTEFIALVFNQIATAEAYVRRLYRFFVKDEINQEVENDIITPLAIQLKNDNYDVTNTLKTLLKSKHFYDEDDTNSQNEAIGGKIKPPLELVFQAINIFDALTLPSLNADPNNYADERPARFAELTLELCGWSWYPLSVEGYPGFFKAPQYSKKWYDQSTIGARTRLPHALIAGTTIITNNVLPFKVNLVEWVDQNFANPDHGIQLVQSILGLAFPEPIEGLRFDYFRDKLLGGVSEINWSFDWLAYKNTGNDATVRVALENLFVAILQAPEFHTF